MSWRLDWQNIPKWDALRTIGQSRIVSLTMLAPFIGYLIIFNQGVVDFLHLSLDALGLASGESIQLNLSRLRQLYLGLTLIGVSSILFKWRCPKVILRNRDEYEFINAEINIMTIDRLSDFQSGLRELISQVSDFWKGKIEAASGVQLSENRRQMAGTRPLSWDGWISENRGSIIQVLTTTYAAANQIRFGSRLVITFLYAAGLSFLAWPSLLVFVRVLYTTVSSIR